MINMHTKFEVSSLSRSRDILRGLKVALLSEICQNWRFPMGVGHFEHKFEVDVDVARYPSMDR